MIPNHILVLGGPKSGKIRIVKLVLPHAELELKNGTHSGLIVKDTLKTKYFSTKMNIMVDEFDERNEQTTDEVKIKQFKDWSSEYMSDDCDELREVIKGMIFTFNAQTDSHEYMVECLAAIDDIRNKLSESDGEWNGFMVLSVVGCDKKEWEEIEDLVIPHGLEVVNLEASGVNEYREKIGADRIVEIAETQEWSDVEPNSRQEEYTRAKYSKLKEMSIGLLEAHSEEEFEDDVVDFTELYHKLNNARSVAGSLNESQKEEYVQGVIEDIINYI